jgi:hypothetical protein
VVECPIDEINRPRMSIDTRIRIPPTEPELEQLFTGWRQDLLTCRKFAVASVDAVEVATSAETQDRCTADRVSAQQPVGRRVLE